MKMKLRSYFSVALLFILLGQPALPFQIPANLKFALLGSYMTVPCTYNGSLTGKGLYLILSWDTDNALAYMFDNKLKMNSGADIYRRAMQESFAVKRRAGMSEILLTIQHMRMDFNNLRVICIVKDDEGRGAVVWKSSTTIKIVDPPQIRSIVGTMVNVTLGDRNRVKLFCTASGYPEPTVTWRRRKTDKLIDYQKFTKETLTATCYLPQPVTLDMEGFYDCVATTKHQYLEYLNLNGAQDSVKLNVHYRPRIAVKDHFIYTDVGHSVNVTIEVTGNPRPTLECSFISINEDRYIRVRDTPSKYRFRYEVQLLRVRSVDIRDYPCSCKNRVGKDTVMIRLRLGPSRPVIVSPRRTRYSDYYGLKWSVLSMARLHNTTLELSRRNASGSVISVRRKFIQLRHLTRRVASANQTFLYHVTNLSSASTYVARVRTCNSYQCSPFSLPMIFVTRRYNGRNKADRSVYDRSSATHRPSNIRSVRTCSYALGRGGCSSSGLPPSTNLPWLSLLLLLFRLLD